MNEPASAGPAETPEDDAPAPLRPTRTDRDLEHHAGDPAGTAEVEADTRYDDYEPL